MPVFVFIIILALFIIGLLVRSGGEGIHLFEDKGTRGERIVGSVLADLPEGYFPCNDPQQKPPLQWRSTASLLYSNWINYYVYQATPYNIEDIR